MCIGGAAVRGGLATPQQRLPPPVPRPASGPSLAPPSSGLPFALNTGPIQVVLQMSFFHAIHRHRFPSQQWGERDMYRVQTRVNKAIGAAA